MSKKSQQNAEKNKSRRNTGVHKDYDAARLVNERAQGYIRQREWKPQVAESDCGCVVAKCSLADHRKTKKHLKRVSVKETLPSEEKRLLVISLAHLWLRLLSNFDNFFNSLPNFTH
jgi:hypothetical protein